MAENEHVHDHEHHKSHHHHHHHHHHDHGHQHEQEAENMLTAVKKDLAVIEFNNTFWKAAHVSYHDNLILSPMNVSFLLALMRLGSRGNTHREIVTTMKFHDEKIMVEECHLLIESMRNEPEFGIDLIISNAIFAPPYCIFRKELMEVAETKFLTHIIPMDFSNPDHAAQEINSWVDTATQCRISEIISKDDLTSDNHLVIINTICFKGQWKVQFPLENTAKQTFFVAGGKKAEVEMMMHTMACPYANLPQFKARAIGLPYRDGRYSLVIVLPEKRYGLSEVEKRLDAKFSLTIFSELSIDPSTLIEVHLPKFQLTSTDNVKSIFARIGMKALFQENAELSGCFEKHDKKEKIEKIHVSNLIQKIYLEVNEEGGTEDENTGNETSSDPAAEASASAEEGQVDSETQHTDIIPFVVDHPFLYFLMDSKFGTTVFIGVQAVF
jgi:serpin B